MRLRRSVSPPAASCRRVRSIASTPNATLPVMVASQTGSQGINRSLMAALSTAAIAPLVLVGIFLERFIITGMTAGGGR